MDEPKKERKRRGNIFNRGTRACPKLYVKYRAANGKWTMKLSHQPTRALAEEYRSQLVAGIAAGRIGLERPGSGRPMEELMRAWLKGLQNRDAENDRARVEKNVLPAFRKMTIDQVDLAAVLTWIDRQRAAKDRLSDATIRHNLNALSRFFSWAVDRRYTAINPVRLIPTGRRPRQTPKSDKPWLADDDVVQALFKALPEPINLMFFIGNRSGLRTGEVCGLRMSDLGFLEDGAIRVRFSYDGPLKEDKHAEGKVKWAPATDDAVAFLGPWLKRREREGATADSLVFPHKGGLFHKVALKRAWDVAAKAVGVDVTWYEATRHSFVSRNLLAGVSLDEVSSAVGHSSPVVTKRHYDHLLRRTFSPALRAPLTPKPKQR